ncbi:hypothetical protein M4D52_05385 [Paenibacillus lactis]|uniref:hypothetical protein n=1 Tax=Paenibacillus lactis TaxID=228574 RepID=UPI00203EAF36|nr:hypothetical protein [Paenibacillus lactis]MCM3492873.1 hypothetical protein [Paenibacillus lactis]
MTFYIRNKETQEDYVVQEIDITAGTVTLRDEEEPLRLADVIEEYEFKYDIW